jgi:glycosyltransferase involved in cell wall biosynthesis
MASVDVYGRTQELDKATLDAIVTRLEYRAKQPVFIKILDEYLDRLSLTSIHNLLDLGCGTGFAPRTIAQRSEFQGHITGIDISPGLIEAARRLSQEDGVSDRIEYHVGDTHSLDLADATFDAVIAHTLVSHVADPFAVIKEAGRIVRPDGWVVIFDGDYASLTFGTEDPDYGRRMDEAIIKSVPFVTTMHGRLDLPGLSEVLRQFPRAGFVSISDHQRLPLPEANWTATIPHGLPSNNFRPSFDQGSYLAFLGRLTAEKGPQDAIRIARAAGMPLRIAAKIPRGETTYFRKQLEPHIDGRAVQLVGEVDEAKKQPFLAEAAALLFPIDWPEPFGLVMIEAMACGTPVIAYRSGSVPEVVEDGVTGFIVENEEQAVRAVGD